MVAKTKKMSKIETNQTGYGPKSSSKNSDQHLPDNGSPPKPDPIVTPAKSQMEGASFLPLRQSQNHCQKTEGRDFAPGAFAKPVALSTGFTKMIMNRNSIWLKSPRRDYCEKRMDFKRNKDMA